MSVKKLSSDLLASLAEEAVRSPRARQHRNLHQSYEDPCQRLLNAIGMDSYIRPHRHALDPKSECLVAVRGMFALLVFDDGGTLQELVRFGTEKYCESGELNVGVELSPGTWHTVIALVPNSVLLELKAGPFDPSAAKELAPWAPEEGGADANRYLNELRCRIAAMSPSVSPL